jgi:hypothetical protein
MSDLETPDYVGQWQMGGGEVTAGKEREELRFTYCNKFSPMAAHPGVRKRQQTVRETPNSNKGY